MANTQPPEVKQYSYTVPIKPGLTESVEVKPDVSEFSDSDRAQAIIQNLKLSVGDTVREDENTYTINPRMVLKGAAPETYKATMENLKKVLTTTEITAISRAINKKGDHHELYQKIVDRISNNYYYKGEFRKTTTREIKDALTWLKANCFYWENSLSYLLSESKFVGSEPSGLTCYKLAWKNKPIPNIQEWQEEDDGQYEVLTDSEADEKARDYLDDDWIEAVKAGRTESSKEDWIDEVIGYGRGEILNHYNGCEEEEEINGTAYYIYRTN